MAYNLQSLITILQRILNPEERQWIACHNIPQVGSLLEKATSLQQILEKSSLPKIESLEIQIREAAHKAEDIVESHMADLHSRTLIGCYMTCCKCFGCFPLYLQEATQELDLLREQVVKLAEGEKKSSTSTRTSSSTRASSFSSVVVGVDEALLQLKDRLTRTEGKLEIVPIVGMGGIGKTTLARKLFLDPVIVSRFVARAWTTVSQDYDMRAILSDLLRCIIGKEFDDKHVKKGNGELIDILYQSLYGRRYLIVLDDVWSNRAWEDLRRYFPNNDNGSHIVITTRESDVATYAAGSLQSLQHKVQLLSDSVSWDLLCQIVFGKGDCPDELREAGEMIVGACGGLPLAISVIGGILSEAERTKDVWEGVGKDARAAIAGSDEQFSNILSLSYEHLPSHLRPCFLYMGAFREDHAMEGSKLIWTWLAEGFLKSDGKRNTNNKSLEEVGEEYLKAMVERNLLSIKQKNYNGKPMSYTIHDLLREVCLKKAEEEKFLHVFKSGFNSTSPEVRRVSAYVSRGLEGLFDSTEAANVMPLARTFICFDFEKSDIISFLFLAPRLLRVLDIKKEYFNYFPEVAFQLVNLRYIAFSCYDLPAGISRLLHLQILIAYMHGPHVSEIWEMTELRHVEFHQPVETVYSEKAALVERKKLQSISNLELNGSLLSRGFLESIPNIKNLGIFYCDSAPVDLSHLHKLETLTCESVELLEDYLYFVRDLRFPSSLKELTLVDCYAYSRELSALCELPELEFLRILNCRVGEEWEVAEGDEFISLRILRLEGLDVKHWRADETNFPKLGFLVIRDCGKLEEIPNAIGEIATLQEIDLESCGVSLVESATRIQEEQLNYGNETLILRVS